MPLTVFPLGYTNSNYLYKMVMNHKKISSTTRQITTATTRNIANIFTTYRTDNITTDAPEVQSITETEVRELDTVIPVATAIAMAIFLSMVFLFIWFIEKRRWRSRSSRRSPQETSPLLPRTPWGSQPPSYAELSPSYPSPPAYEELHLVAGTRCTRPSPTTGGWSGPYRGPPFGY